MRSALVILTIAFLASSCNPSRRINIKNESGGDVSVIWTLKELDSLYKSPLFISNSMVTRFDLKPNAPYNEVKMSFGLGSWPKDTLAMITDRIQSLEIRSKKKTMRLDSSKAVYSFLANRIKGFGKRKIVILITE